MSAVANFSRWLGHLHATKTFPAIGDLWVTYLGRFFVLAALFLSRWH